MHIVVAYPNARITEPEARLVRRVAALAKASAVTVLVVSANDGVLACIEQLRATVERLVARASLEILDVATLEGGKVQVRTVRTGDIAQAIAKIVPDIVINLSGMDIGPVPVSSCTIVELWWDDSRPEALGLTRAGGDPPVELVVTVRDARSNTLRRVQQCTLTRTPETDAADRKNASLRSLALILRAVRAESMPAGEDFVPIATVQKSSSAAFVRALATIVISIASAIARRATHALWRRNAWEVRYRTSPQFFASDMSAFASHEFRRLRSDYDRYYADPIPFSHNGIDALFVEEYSYATQLGKVSACILQGNGTLTKPRAILEFPYHLSYPFVFTHDNNVYLIPETSANRTVDLHRCEQFPYSWTFERTLLAGVALTDCTPYFDGTRWWLFATANDEGSYGWDELHLYMSDALSGEWTAHPANPVKCDARSARPAGPLFRKDGKLLRPTQDCSVSYGGAVNLCEVDELTPITFREHEVARLSPTAFEGADGLHTLAASECMEAIDVRMKRRYRWSR